MILAVIGFATAALGADVGEASERIPVKQLIFTFPDGARGGHGEIQGSGAWPRADVKALTLSRIRACGARGAQFSSLQMSHRFIIDSVSTRNDREVVRCVQQSVPLHFHVRLFDGQTDTDEPFREFWASPGKLKNEAK